MPDIEKELTHCHRVRVFLSQWELFGPSPPQSLTSLSYGSSVPSTPTSLDSEPSSEHSIPISIDTEPRYFTMRKQSLDSKPSSVHSVPISIDTDNSIPISIVLRDDA